MNGVLATDLIEVTSDPEALSDGGFWAVSTTFEGKYTFAKFATVIRGASFPETGEWSGLTDVWESSILQTGYEDYVSEIRNQIVQGNVYQVNACRILSTKISKERSLAPLFSKMTYLTIFHAVDNKLLRDQAMMCCDCVKTGKPSRLRCLERCSSSATIRINH